MRDFKKNEQYEAVVEGYSSEAFGVCRIDGRAVFLPKALKGERWQLKIVKASANAAYARGERLLAPSPERMEPDRNAEWKGRKTDFRNRIIRTFRIRRMRL